MKRSKVIAALLALSLVVTMLGVAATPAQASTAASSGECVYHYVQRGQTLSGIAKYYGVNMWTLAERNGIYNPNRIYAGQRLLIYCKPAPQPKPPPKPQPKPPAHPPLPPGHPPCQPGCPQPPPPPPPQCSITPVLGFGKVWSNNPQVRATLGCPTSAEYGLNAVEQHFNGGYALADLNAKTTYVFYSNGTWTTIPTNYDPNAPVPTPYLVPPQGWQVPQPVQATLQYYQNGMMLWSASQGVYVLYNNGTYKLFK